MKVNINIELEGNKEEIREVTKKVENVISSFQSDNSLIHIRPINVDKIPLSSNIFNWKRKWR